MEDFKNFRSATHWFQITTKFIENTDVAIAEAGRIYVRYDNPFNDESCYEYALHTRHGLQEFGKLFQTHFPQNKISDLKRLDLVVYRNHRIGGDVTKHVAIIWVPNDDINKIIVRAKFSNLPGIYQHLLGDTPWFYCTSGEVSFYKHR